MSNTLPEGYGANGRRAVGQCPICHHYGNDCRCSVDAYRRWYDEAAKAVAYLATWRPASGARQGWRICREFCFPLIAPNGGSRFQEAKGPKGKVRYFKTQEAARRAAAKLNAACAP